MLSRPIFSIPGSIKLFWICAVILALSACGGGGGGGDGGSGGGAGGGGDTTTKSAPVIESITFLPTSGVAGETISIEGQLSFNDPDGDLDGGTLRYTYESVTYDISLPTSLAGVKNATVEFTLTAQLSAFVGEVTIPTWIVDKAGLVSNTIDVIFEQTDAGGGSSTKSAPVLEAITFTPPSGIAGETFLIEGELSFSDPDGDLDGGTFRYTYESVTYDIPLPDSLAGVQADIVDFTLTIQISEFVGNVTIPTWIVDKEGLVSNTIDVNFEQTSAVGGGSPNDSAPWLESITFLPNSGVAGRTITIEGQFAFGDMEGDLDGGTLNYTYESMTYQIDLPDSLAGVQAAIVDFTLTVQISEFVGNVTIPTWIVDKEGLVSNTIDVNFEQLLNPPAPQPPANLNAASSASDKSMITWDPIPSMAQKSCGVAIARKTGQDGIYAVVGSVSLDQAQFIDTQLTPATEYFYKAFSYCSYESHLISDYSSETSVITKSFGSTPNPPSGLVAIPSGGWSVDLSWTDNSSDEDGFLIERSSDDINYIEIQSLSNNRTSFTDKSVSENTNYFYRVRAYNHNGSSVPTATEEVNTPAAITTDLSGGYAEDLTLTKADSPYLVSADLTIAPNFTLHIEAGVHIRVAIGVSIEVRGHLMAIGTPDEPILITALDATTNNMGYWSGIHLANNLSGSAIVQNIRISNASSAFFIDCCYEGGPLEIYDSNFESNSVALNGYSGFNMPVYRSKFVNNGVGVGRADKIIAYSDFQKNNYGLFQTERISVYFSTFSGHTQAGLYGGRGEVKGSIIENNEVGTKPFFGGFKLSHNIIAHNNDIGVILGADNSQSPKNQLNNIFDNTNYDIANGDSLEKDATNNWWGSTSINDIEQKVLDFSDDASLGIIQISPVLEMPIDIIP